MKQQCDFQHKETMENYNFDRLEKLKVEFYTVIGRLELEAGVIVNKGQLEIFETAVQNCKSENEAAACILGNTRRFESMFVSKCSANLDEETDQKAAANPTSKILYKGNTLLVPQIAYYFSKYDEILNRLQATIYWLKKLP